MTLNKRLVGHWTMDDRDISNGEIFDRSAHSNHGEINSGVTSGNTGILGEALNFDGTGYVPTHLYYNTNDLKAVSISCWYNSSSSSQQIIISSDRNEYWRLGVGSDGVDGVLWTVFSSDIVSNAGSATLQDGNWHHIVAVFDSSLTNDHKIYIDNTLDKETNVYSNGGGSNATSYTNIGVGSEAGSFNGSTGPDDYMNGKLDDIRVYHRGLSESEVNQLYQMREQKSSNVRIFPELVENRSFEQDSLGTDTPTGWVDNSGNWIVTDERSFDGSQSFGNFYKGVGVYPSAFMYQEFPDIKPDNKYRASVYLNSPSGSGNGDGSGGQNQHVWEDDGRLRITAYDSSDTEIGRWETIWMGETTNLNPNEWNYREVVFITPTDTDYVRLNIDGGDGNNSVIDKDAGHGGNAGLFIDNASLKTFTKQ